MSLSSKRQGDQDHPSLEGVRVLVVEDTWHVAKALKSELEQVGMDVSGPAATTTEARRLVVEHMPLVAVVDVNLKGEMAGGLIDELHDQGISVVVVSGYAVPRSRPTRPRPSCKSHSAGQNCWPPCVE
jgi:DNA-binding NtrC family response regulator